MVCVPNAFTTLTHELIIASYLERDSARRTTEPVSIEEFAIQLGVLPTAVLADLSRSEFAHSISEPPLKNPRPKRPSRPVGLFLRPC